ncbi:MAG: hypothetical protein CME99_04995 [Hyphomonas sp.]|uniref:Lipoprotein n=1 Tax=Hyphomonas atlantica TaxID=1280948 RepID=A0A059DZS6_9PROT|nr:MULTISPECIES: hypothetical protein [Hyphomonas]KCZ59832.1 hypothetical protein HY36_06800 [Hyphomonas atlantica]MAH92515.1 hypothetical protein [Hyphomonas sp.]OUX88162.1 MAG: hypothetical protein CBB91_04760 [Hyphomonas sp. TMED31]HBF89852.1 hypothetical protein [Hyphomonas atlantica]
MKPYVMIVAAAMLAACTSTQSYGPASGTGKMGYSSQQIETGRYQVSYTDSDASRARDRALLRAAELTLQEGADWFEIVNSYTEQSADGRRTGSSVSIGGSSGSYGRSSGVGVGVGIGFPLGGGSGPAVTEVLEILTGTGEKPDRPNAYDARSVDINLRGTVTE